MDNKEKLEYIASNYIKMMHHEANAILKDYHYAEDACQDAFINLCKVVDRIEDVTSPSARAYCIRTAKNCAVNIIRKNGRDMPMDEVYDADNDLRAIYDHYPSDAVDMVNDIEELPEKYRNVIRMRCLEDMSAEQTAQKLGTNVNTVNTHLLRARKLLRDKWAAIAAVAVCVLAVFGGRYLLQTETASTVNYEAQVYEESIAENDADAGSSVDPAPAAAQEAATDAEEDQLPDEILDQALKEVEGATADHITGQKVLDPGADDGAAYEVIIRKDDKLHTIRLDAAGKILMHTVE